jgi:formylglycine-generating enzyme required for sulfatase activity
MRPSARNVTAAGLATATLALLPVLGSAANCPIDSVRVGTNCVDKYEASLWTVPAANTALVKKIRKGKVTLAELTAGGATWVGCTDVITAGTPPAYPATFPPTGNWTQPVYAVSIPGVKPSTCMTWFQAVQACALSEKRLLTNVEWQAAAAGTADPGGADDQATTCVVDAQTGTQAPVLTGSRSGCVSSWGVFDMVGNVSEWSADWAPGGFPVEEVECTTWGALYGDDLRCFQGEGSPAEAGVLVRGGDWNSGAEAGVFSVQSWGPKGAGNARGVRCVRSAG